MPERVAESHTFASNIVTPYALKKQRERIQVVIVAGFHLFPFRTEKLSPPAPMVLHTRGRVGSRRFSAEPLQRMLRGLSALGRQPATCSPTQWDWGGLGFLLRRNGCGFMIDTLVWVVILY